MKTKDNIRDEQLQYDIKREAVKYQHHDQISLINMNIFHVKKYYLIILFYRECYHKSKLKTCEFNY